MAKKSECAKLLIALEHLENADTRHLADIGELYHRLNAINNRITTLENEIYEMKQMVSVKKNGY